MGVDGRPIHAWHRQPTYEGLKLVAYIFGEAWVDSSPAYLRGIETGVEESEIWKEG